MTLTIETTAILIGAALIAGCSSTRQHTTRMSYAETEYAPPTYTDTAHNDTMPAYDRRSPIADTVPTTSFPITTSRVTTTRTVNMAVSPAIRYDITLDEFRGHIREQSAIFVDARQPKEFRKGHVTGAINIPVGDEDAYIAKFQEDVAPDQLVIVYCGGPECPASDNVASYLSTQGYSNIRVYKPGWQQLSKVDLP